MGTLDWLFQNLAQTMNCENWYAMVLIEGGPASRTRAALSMFGRDKIYEIFITKFFVLQTLLTK